MTTATHIRLHRQLTPVQFQQLCARLHEFYPGWQQPPGAQTGAWVQVAYNGHTLLIHPRRDYVLEADVASTVHRLLNELPAPGVGAWFLGGTLRRRTLRRGSPLT
jgi:hypothetical protein